MSGYGFTCSICGKVCRSKQGLGAHSKVHKTTSAQSQHHVSTITPSPSNLPQQYTDDIDENDVPTAASSVSYHNTAPRQESQASSYFEVLGEVAVIKYRADLPVHCALCKSRVGSKVSYGKDIVSHCWAKHNMKISKVVFRCATCDTTLTDLRKAKSHMAVHFGQQDVQIPTYECSTCKSVFTTAFGLSSHRGKGRCNQHGEDSGAAAASLPENTNDIADESVMQPPHTDFSVLHDVADVRRWFEQQPQLSQMDDDTNVPMIRSTVITCSDEWLNNMFPPVEKKISLGKRKGGQVSNRNASRVALQRLYSRSPKSAMRSILQEPVIQCGLSPEDCCTGLANQLRQRDIEPVPKEWWSPATRQVDLFNADFKPEEVVSVLKHSNTAPGRSGWRYSDIRARDNTGDRLAGFLNYVRLTTDIPSRWQHYSTRLLFKKPNKYQLGEEKVFTNFRPIALLDVEYKVLTSILARRLSDLLKYNNCLNAHQRAVFGRRGCNENALLARHALQDGKQIIFLDLSDAFNSISHELIRGALEATQIPQWFVDLVLACYSNTYTIPIHQNGDAIGDKVPVLSGVRQGCPLSPILFCLAINPLLEEVSRLGGTPLAYMDDIAVVCDNSRHGQHILNGICRVADALGLSFNAAKCGTTTTEQLLINNKAVPRVTDSEQYQYLGILLGPAVCDSAEKVLDTVVQLAGKVEQSELKPQQKIHCLRSMILPKAYYAVQHGAPTITKLKQVDTALARMARTIMSLPDKATTSYLRAPRSAGAPGIPSLDDTMARMRVADFLHAWNDRSEFGSMMRRAAIASTKRQLPKEIPGLVAVIKYISGAPTSGSCGGGWLGEVRNAVRRLTNNCGMQVLLESDTAPNNSISNESTNDSAKICLCINGEVAHRPWQCIRNAQEAWHWKQWVESPNQGRFAAALSSTKVTSLHTYSYRMPFCDWRFAHSARLNLTPLRGAATWSSGDKMCRRCNGGAETMAHVLSLCNVHKKEWMNRHRKVLETVVDSLPGKWQVLKEQRQGDVIPDLVLLDRKAHRALIVDVKVSIDLWQTFNNNVSDVTSKYEELRRHYESQAYSSSIKVLQMGALGSVPKHTLSCLRAIMGTDKKARHLAVKLAAICLHSSRNTVVEHITGITQSH